MSHREREGQRDQSNREELVERMAQGIPHDGRLEPFKGLFLARSSTPTEAVFGVVEPSVCFIAQGSKEMHLGKKRYQYDAHNYLVACLELPVALRVLEASREQPYLGLRLNLAPALVGSVLVELGISPQKRADAQAFDVSRLDFSLLDAVLRLVRLLDSPSEARLLMPLITREIVYRLLVGEQGERLRRMTLLGGHTHRIAQAVKRICRDSRQPMSVQDVSHSIGMSVSSFHAHFKAATSMSPLQFQKQLRLQEARRLLVAEHIDAASAGFQVGYDDAAHFSRDYKRLFGTPPIRDVARFREAATQSPA